jgi:hypothetical protein
LAPYTSGSAPGYVNNFDRSYRYKEERLYAGKEVFVIGTMTEEVVSTASAEMLEEDSEDLAENQGLEQTGAAGAETEVDEDISLEEADLLELERLLEPEEDVEGALRTANATTRRRLKDCRVISGVPREQLLSMSRLGGRVVFGAMIALLCVIGILLGFRLLA